MRNKLILSAIRQSVPFPRPRILLKINRGENINAPQAGFSPTRGITSSFSLPRKRKFHSRVFCVVASVHAGFNLSGHFSSRPGMSIKYFSPRRAELLALSSHPPPASPCRISRGKHSGLPLKELRVRRMGRLLRDSPFRCRDIGVRRARRFHWLALLRTKFMKRGGARGKRSQRGRDNRYKGRRGPTRTRL